MNLVDHRLPDDLIRVSVSRTKSERGFNIQTIHDLKKLRVLFEKEVIKRLQPQGIFRTPPNKVIVREYKEKQLGKSEGFSIGCDYISSEDVYDLLFNTCKRDNHIQVVQRECPDMYVRIQIRSNDDNEIRTIAVENTTLGEVVELATDLYKRESGITKDEYAGNCRIDIREVEDNVNGKSRRMRFNSVDPDELHTLFLNAINEYADAG